MGGLSSVDHRLEALARQAGFDSFRAWVEYTHTQRRIEEDEYRVNATRLMWGEAEAQREKERLANGQCTSMTLSDY